MTIGLTIVTRRSVWDSQRRFLLDDARRQFDHYAKEHGKQVNVSTLHGELNPADEGATKPWATIRINFYVEMS